MHQMILGLSLWLLGYAMLVLNDWGSGLLFGLSMLCVLAGVFLIVRGYILRKKKQCIPEKAPQKVEGTPAAEKAPQKVEGIPVAVTAEEKTRESVYDAFHALTWTQETSLEELCKVSSHMQFLLKMKGIVPSQTRYLFRYIGIDPFYYFHIPAENKYFFITFEWNRRSDYITFVETTEKTSVLEVLCRMKSKASSQNGGLSPEEIERLIAYVQARP